MSPAAARSWIFKLALTLAALWLALSGIEAESLVEMLNEQKPLYLLGTVFFILVQILFGVWRWRLIVVALAGGDKKVLSWRAAHRLYYTSVFFNHCLPGLMGGDVVRVWLAKSDGVPLPLAINSVIIDRLLALLALGALMLLTLPLLAEIAGFDMWPVLLAVFAAATASAYCFIRVERWLAPFAQIKPVHWLLYFTGCLRMMFTHRRASLVSLLYAVLAHVSFCLSAWMLAKSLSMELGMLESLALIPPVILAITLPISIGGWGVREISAAGLLGLVGIAKAGGVLLAVQIGFINILVSLPAGLLWLLHRKKKTA